MCRLSNVLVPGSSPSGAKIQAPAHPRGEPFDLRHVCRIGETPSDSIAEEMVVTPSAEVMARRQPEEETQEEQAERRREERAKVVAAGWCSKYAFVADTVSRSQPHPIKLMAVSSGVSEPLSHKEATGEGHDIGLAAVLANNKTTACPSGNDSSRSRGEAGQRSVGLSGQTQIIADQRLWEGSITCLGV